MALFYAFVYYLYSLRAMLEAKSLKMQPIKILRTNFLKSCPQKNKVKSNLKHPLVAELKLKM